MNELDINKMNEEIGYEEGKIYWEHCKGHTSKLIQNLMKSGYSVVKSGSVHTLKDNKNKKVLSAYSWEGLLYGVAKLMR